MKPKSTGEVQSIESAPDEQSKDRSFQVRRGEVGIDKSHEKQRKLRGGSHLYRQGRRRLVGNANGKKKKINVAPGKSVKGKERRKNIDFVIRAQGAGNPPE